MESHSSTFLPAVNKAKQTLICIKFLTILTEVVYCPRWSLLIFFCMEENEYFSILANILNAQVGYVSAGKCITVNK